MRSASGPAMNTLMRLAFSSTHAFVPLVCGRKRLIDEASKWLKSVMGCFFLDFVLGCARLPSTGLLLPVVAELPDLEDPNVALKLAACCLTFSCFCSQSWQH